MADKFQLMLEAEQRGILPEKQQALLTEARGRGLIDPVGEKSIKSQALRKGANFFRETGKDIGERKEKLERIGEAQIEGRISAPVGAASMVGQGALAGLDVVGNLASELIPDPIEEALGKVVGKGVELVGSIPTPSGKNLGQETSEFIKENPDVALVGESLTGVLAAGTPPGTTGILKGTGQTLKKQALTKKTKFIDKHVIAEVPTQKTLKKASEEGRVVQKGLNRKKQITQNRLEKKISTEVAKLPINTKGNVEDAVKVIRSGIKDKANELRTNARKSNAIISKTEILSKIDKNLDNAIDEKAFLIGNAGLKKQQVKAIIMKELDDAPGTPEGLLDARQRFDTRLREQTLTASGKDIFDNEQAKAINVAIADIRDTMNNALNKVVPGSEDLLRSQSLLYRGRDLAAANSAKMRGSVIERIAGNIEKLSVGSAAPSALAVTALAYISSPFVVARRGLATPLAPIVREQAGNVILKIDETLSKIPGAQQGSRAVRELKADRAFILKTLQDIEEQNNETE